MRKHRLTFNHLLMVMTCLFLGYSGVSQAATVDDLKVCMHSYVMVADDYTNNGTGSRTQGGLFGSDFFLDVTGGSVATNKGATDLSLVDTLGIDKEPLYVTQEIVEKYGGFGKHLNSLRLKNTQDVIAMRPTAGSKIIFFLQGNNKTGKDARYPKLSKSSDLSDPLNDAPTADFSESTVAGFKLEYTVPNDWGADDVLYMGSYNGDMFISYIIVEVPEAEWAPTVMVGKQTFEDGLWYREVTCTAKKANGFETIVTYTTDGTAPTASSPVYTAPIKCYQDMTVIFQAFLDHGTGTVEEADFLQNASNEIAVNFQFDAPTIEVDGSSFAIISPYIDQNGVNYYQVSGMTYEGNEATLTESGTIMAYTEIVNGDYATFKSKTMVQDVYVLNPIKEKKTIKVVTDDVVLNEWEVYRIENGAISADKEYFFVKDLECAAITDPSYQVEDVEGYIKMNSTNITFLVADGDSVYVKVVCSKNSCKNLYSDNDIDRMCYVDVDGITYCHMDADGNDAADQQLYPDANIIEFGLGSGYHTFQKYSHTGNIFIASIEITPVEKTIVNEIPEPELAWGKLAIVEEITKDVKQKPRTNYEGDKVEVDLTEALSKLGISAALVQEELCQLLFAKKAYVTENTVIGAQMSDSLTNESSAGGIGFWFRNVSDLEGNPTFECGRFAYDGDDCFFADAFEYNVETGILSCNIGQMPNKLKGGNTYFADIYIVYGDKAIKIRYNLILPEVKVGTLEDYEKAGEHTVRVEMEPAESYETKNFSIGIETMVNALGCELGEIDDFYMLDTEIDFAGKNMEGVGYWVSMEGKVINWGTDAMFYITPKADDYSKFGIGQYPGHMNVGDSVRVILYFVAGSKYYQLNIDLLIVEPKSIDVVFESVAQRSIEVQQVPGEYVWTSGVEIPEEWVEQQIGTSDWVLYALAKLNDDGSEKEGNDRYSKQYNCTPYPGFWMDAEGRCVGWNQNSTRLGVSVASPEGMFSLMQHPGVTLADVFRFPIFLVNEENGKMVTFNFTYSIVESVVEIEEVGSEEIVLPVSNSDEGASTTIDLSGVLNAFDISLETLANGQYLHGITADGTYGSGVSLYDGLAFTDKGVCVTEDPFMFFDAELNEDGKSITLTTFTTAEVADDYTAMGTICFLVDSKRYVFNVKFVSERNFVPQEEKNMVYIADGLRFSTTKMNMLPISLQNEDEIVGFQFDVVLPQGMTVALDDEEDYIVTSENTRAKEHSLSCNVLGDGTIRIVGTSLSNKKIASGDGLLLNMGINIASWLENGDYAIQLKNVKFTNADKKTVLCSDKVFYVTVGGKLGDVNQDDAVDVTDAVLIIDHILAKNPANFDASLADVNGDGDIDVTDVVFVIDAILGKIELSRGADLIDRSAYTAFQMDLTIPAGYVLENVSLTDIAKDSHSLAYTMLPDGRCRVVVCSMNNEALPGAWDEVICLNLRGQGDAQVNIDRAVFVTIDGERHELMMNPTSIAELSTFKSPLGPTGRFLQKELSTRYDLQGRKVEKNAKGILIDNGKKTVRK